jgi:predicted metal-dependent phosphoesterase TrpH
MPPSPGGFIDLHSHSLASDGQHPAAVVAAKAASAGVGTWALTDHDSIAALEQGRAAAEKLGVRFVPGIELSVYLDRREVHLLGHFVDPDSGTLRRFEDLLAEKRRLRMGEIVSRLAALGIALSPDEIERFSGGKTLGRPHVARALVARGVASSVREAFDLWLGEGKPAYVPRFRLTVAEAIRLVRDAGGTSTIAHPGLSGVQRGDLERMKGWGLDGVEVDHAEHNPSTRDKYRRLCGELDLVPTAGTDYHGEAVSPDRVFGEVTMAIEELARLEARRP